MRKIAQVLAGAITAVTLSGGIALAATSQSCSISGATGPNSVNTCTNQQTNTITISCTNVADVLNINGQVATSGTATVNGNTGVGTVQTGNSGNSNFTYNNANISCAPVATASSGGQGSGGSGAGSTGSSAAPASSPAVKSLPNTGSDSKTAVAVIATASFAGLAGLVRFGSSAYRKLS